MNADKKEQAKEVADIISKKNPWQSA